jgi:hypothetical protein
MLPSSLLSQNIKTKIYRSITLPVIFDGCQAGSLKLREKHRLRMCENRVLRKIFGPKTDEVPRECRKLHNEELN